MSAAELPRDWNPPTLDDVRAAAQRIEGRVHKTPVMSCADINSMTGSELIFKCENLQRIGAFKARGAMNAVWSLDEEEAARGVATHSSGNHGAALALAARSRDMASWVVVPDNAAAVKRESVRREGAAVVDCAPGMNNREAALARVVEETGAIVVHPYDDDRVIAGQGTAALELLNSCQDLSMILAPVGGGGLISGTAIAAKGLNPSIKVIACEPAAADDARRSFEQGQRLSMDAPDTIADGLRASLGRRNFRIICDLVDDVVTVSETGIMAATRLVWERMRIVIEPSAAVPVAALLEEQVPGSSGVRIGVILTGGNVDLDALRWS
ncbi:MAG: pyridoxal-phosphate dependent enzyme [Chromatiales bacterium]|jgi:threonine dehydratase|nr:pyridoxal-phosphate dependent enzyme [Chromatiales bacterium]